MVDVWAFPLVLTLCCFLRVYLNDVSGNWLDCLLFGIAWVNQVALKYWVGLPVVIRLGCFRDCFGNGIGGAGRLSLWFDIAPADYSPVSFCLWSVSSPDLGFMVRCFGLDILIVPDCLILRFGNCSGFVFPRIYRRNLCKNVFAKWSIFCPSKVNFSLTIR